MTNDIVKTSPTTPQFRLDQFEDGSAFEWLFNNFSRSPGALAVQSNELKKQADLVGFKRYSKFYEGFEKQARLNRMNEVLPGHTEFSNSDITLDCGNWECVDWGISRNTMRGREIACHHPIMPVERLINIDEPDNVKYRLAYMCSIKTRKWRTIVVDRQVISSSRSITALSRYDIAVTSTNASVLVDYLNDIIHLNHDTIPERKSVSRLGYVEEEGFAPYIADLVFDGDTSFKNLYNSVQSHGSQTEWYRIALECRQMSVTAKILLAASFASPLLSIVGSLPFFVHLWGVDSGTGKTVALMLAASVWGNPAVGSYVQTFNGTQVGQERTAAFLNHLPMCLDELQLTKNSKGQSNFDVYQLAQGVGRARGTKTGGVDKVPTWSCCFLTTGESPITSGSAGAGAVNRVIDIECASGLVAIKDGHRIANKLKQLYGWAGQDYVEKIYESDAVQEQIRELYQDIFRELCDGDSTEKQAMAAAAILTADLLATNWIFKDDNCLTVEEIRNFLASKEAVSVGKRAYSWICSWVSSHSNKFIREKDLPPQGEIYGKIEGDTAYINKEVFVKAVSDAGFSERSVLSYLKAEHLISVRDHGKGYTRAKRITDAPIECIALMLPEYIDDSTPFDDEPL